MLLIHAQPWIVKFAGWLQRCCSMWLQTVTTQVEASSSERLYNSSASTADQDGRFLTDPPSCSIHLVDKHILPLTASGEVFRERDLSSISGTLAPPAQKKTTDSAPIPHWLPEKLQVNMQSTWQYYGDSQARPETPAIMSRSSLTASCFIQLMNGENRAWCDL